MSCCALFLLQLDPSAAAAADQQEPQQGAEDAAQQQYSDWLTRQYSSYTAQLLQLISSGSSASLQVAAVAAVLECVRHEEGPAAFSNRLYARLLTTLVFSPHTQPEVRGVLLTPTCS